MSERQNYREMKVVVISQDDFPLVHRGDLALKPAPGTTAILLNGIARQIVDLGLAQGEIDATWKASLANYDLVTVSAATGIEPEKITQAATIYATGGAGLKGAKDGVFPPSVLYQTAAHQGAEGISNADGDAAEIAVACNNLAILTGNLGRAGGGVAALRGPANYQGATDMGAHPVFLAGGADVENADARARLESAWLPRWAGGSKTSNGFVPPKKLPATRGLSAAQLAEAIEAGTVKAMYIEGTIAGRNNALDERLLAALPKLEFLVVADYYDSPVAKLAHVVLPLSMSLEKDGTFTNLDRTVQRVRAAVPGAGESKSGLEIVTLLSKRMGYDFNVSTPAELMIEISRLVGDYAGITYARLERGGLNVPVTSVLDAGTPILTAGADGFARLSPHLISTAAD
jgi:predicted molibdopterin-dependent oxidoreductase YjgC